MICACPNPNCQQMFKIDDSFAGKQATCPKCKKPFIIPKAPLEAADKQASPKILPTTAQATIPNTVLKPPPIQSVPVAQAAVNARPVPPKAEVFKTGLKNIHVPPPLSGSTTAQRAPVPTKPPPLPPEISQKTQEASNPPAIPKTVGSATGTAMKIAVDSLVRVLNKQILYFYFLASIAFFLVSGVVSNLLLKSAEALGNPVAIGLCITVVVFIYVGMVGLFAGGVAYLAHMEEQGRSVRVSNAFLFCLQRFIHLFGGAVLLTIIFLLAFSFLNGSIIRLSRGSSVGSFVSALLFLPQLGLNFILTIAIATSAIIPCAIAVENSSFAKAVSRMITCIRRDRRRLVVHLLMTAFFGVILIVLPAAALMLTILTNGSIESGIQSEISQLFREVEARTSSNLGLDFGDSGMNIFKEPSGQGLRRFFTKFAISLLIDFFILYWIVSFTGYYRSVQTTIIASSGAFQRAGP